jgi:hypothetical protein
MLGEAALDVDRPAGIERTVIAAKQVHPGVGHQRQIRRRDHIPSESASTSGRLSRVIGNRS